MTKREAALQRAMAALKKFSQEKITKRALLDAIEELQATKPDHKR